MTKFYRYHDRFISLDKVQCVQLYALPNNSQWKVCVTYQYGMKEYFYFDIEAEGRRVFEEIYEILTED